MNAEEYDQAIQAAQRSSDVFRAHGANQELFAALGELGRMYIRLWRYDEALVALTDCIAVTRQHGDPDELATWIGVLGDLHERSGDDDAALAAYREALASYGPQNLQRLSSTTSIARILMRTGEGRQARELLERTLPTAPASLREHWAIMANQLGVQLTADGDAARALELQRKALEMVDGGRLPLTAFAVSRDLAATYRALGDLDGARTSVARAAEIAQALPGRPYEPVVLREQARNAWQTGDLDQARALLDRAIDGLASHRGHLRAHALRTSSSAKNRGYYEEAIALAMQMHARAPEAGHAARAFELFERSRARTIADLLTEGRVDIRASVDAALLTQQRELQQQLGQKDFALRQAGRDEAGKARAAGLEREIDDLSRALTVLDGRIRAASPRYAALTQPSALSLEDAQRLLDADTVLLAFSLGSTSSWGWAITPTTMRSFELPAAAKIEAQARQVYASLTARQHRARATAAGTAATPLADIDASLLVDAAALSDLVLGPIASSLQGEWRDRRLAIVTTGALEYIPFAALPVPQRTDADARTWLVDAHELVKVPSVSVLGLLRAEKDRRPRAARQRITVLADPVYGADDPRVRARASSMTRRTPAAREPKTTIAARQTPPAASKPGSASTQPPAAAHGGGSTQTAAASPASSDVALLTSAAHEAAAPAR